MENFVTELRALLEIQAPSGEEWPVAEYLKPRLDSLMDTVLFDSYGNLLAEKKCGDSEVTVLLSAHMDTVDGLKPDRQVVRQGNTFYSTSGILGADDRAGIAIIMEVLRSLPQTSFSGTIKVAFSREEETGCVGANEIPDYWLEGTDLAIVVDRRGNRDIVVSCGGLRPFCSERVGKFFEEVSAAIQMDWKAVEGGVSDALAFAERGINSVNLSAGYMDEHTSGETMNIEWGMDTVCLIRHALESVEEEASTFGTVPSEFTSYYEYPFADDYDGASLFGDWGDYEELPTEEGVFFSEEGDYGSTVAKKTFGGIVIEQTDAAGGVSEVILSKEEFERLVRAYFGTTLDKMPSASTKLSVPTV